MDGGPDVHALRGAVEVGMRCDRLSALEQVLEHDDRLAGKLAGVEAELGFDASALTLWREGLLHGDCLALVVGKRGTRLL